MFTILFNKKTITSGQYAYIGSDGKVGAVDVVVQQIGDLLKMEVQVVNDIPKNNVISSKKVHRTRSAERTVELSAEEIKAFKEACRSFNQKEIANEVGIPASMVSNINTGKKKHLTPAEHKSMKEFLCGLFVDQFVE